MCLELSACDGLDSEAHRAYEGEEACHAAALF